MTVVTRLYFVISLASISFIASAQSEEGALWHQTTSTSKITAKFKQAVSAGHEITVDADVLEALIQNQNPEFRLSIPTPAGEFLTFQLSQVSPMAAALAEKYPLVRSFSGYNINNPADKGRFDISSDGLSGMFKIDNQWAILTFDKLANSEDYVSYWVKDEIYPESEKTSLLHQQDYLTIPSSIKASALSTSLLTDEAARANGNSITTYRIAISTSGEYTTENGGEAGTIAELARLINRINQVLVTDMAIQFEIVANNDRIIYTDSATDPFINDASEDLDSNQVVIDDLIGAENYDIGHVLNTDPGGLATIQSICIENFKARGQTGSNRPFGESFYLQLVIHEFGHQLGAEHTFNAANTGGCSEDQRSRNSAVEPGSGSTIMSYAGLCSSQNIQNDADDYFHSFSIEQIQSLLDNRSCGIVASTGNTIPVITTSQINHTIPANTPFVLTANATDADNDPLTYIWDQTNPGGFDGVTETAQELSEDNGANPLFRSFSPSSSPTRYFPQLDSVLTDTIAFGETYPTTERELTFELLVRDGNGGVNTLAANIDVLPTEDAFSVTNPEANVRWIGGQSHAVQWNVASTDEAPISCSNVDIMLDADGDQVFESTLLANTPNDGQQNIISPSTDADSARILVSCSDNVFYAVNPGGFEIVPGNDPVAPLITDQIELVAQEDTPFSISFSDLVVDDPDSSYPSNFTLDILPGANYIATGTSVMPNSDFFGTLTVNLSVNDGVSDSNVFAFSVQVSAVNDAPVANDDAISIEQGSAAVSIDALDNDTDADQDTLIISDVTYLGSGRVTFDSGIINYTPANSFFGTDTIVYRVEDPSFATDSATISITVNQEQVTPIVTPTPTDSTDSSGGGSIGWLLLLLAILRFPFTKLSTYSK